MKNSTFVSESKLRAPAKEVAGELVFINEERFYKISNSNAMRPFFMSVVSDSNHWLFISSNGALTAGRKDSNSALFPYYTDDKITESVEVTGSKSLFRVHADGKTFLWEPFSDRHYRLYEINRHLYKNVYGNKIRFEEVNKDLGLSFTYEWNSSNTFGFVRKASLANNTDSEVKIELLDGLQNILPYGVNSDLQNTRSNLVDAYKRSELKGKTGLGIYTLSAIIVDKAEPSESLKANVVWSSGLTNPNYLVSSLQLDAFREGRNIEEETDIKGEKGAYFMADQLVLQPHSNKDWMIVANVNQGPSAVENLNQSLKDKGKVSKEVLRDIEEGARKLVQLTAASDGLQLSQDELRTSRHFSNVLYNIMRGGIFDCNYSIEKKDFLEYLQNANKELYQKHTVPLKSLADLFTLDELQELIKTLNDPDFTRLGIEYLPLKFSRRHGDPSRPWNKFSINTRSERDGSKILDYQGNWRDIFQNWEALAHSYPQFIDGMIHRFLNASTFDGYNPYRITKSGFDWETIEPDDPWSYIGYWGDHQIIYLLKFLEFIEDYFPGRLEGYYNREIFVYANVPYKIKDYQSILRNPKDTIDFDHKLHKLIEERKRQIGGDGALLTLNDASIYKVNIIEKFLATLLAKCSNFVPDAGIWLNTQRPEWNDANNALVGNGVSMVTLYYLRRFLAFFKGMLQRDSGKEFSVSEELMDFYKSVYRTLSEYQPELPGPISDSLRKKIMDGLGTAGSIYRETIYANGFSGTKQPLDIGDLENFITLTISYLERTIDVNKRKDEMYHSYNLITIKDDRQTAISYLSEMLEGQVAVLSSGHLSPEECLAVLDSLKKSSLYRKDQYSYILYPNKDLPRFLEKNILPQKMVKSSQLLQKLLADGNREIIEQDVAGNYHFNGSFNNVNSLLQAINDLPIKKYGTLAEKEKTLLMDIFEQVFDHKSFTGRSGTFFGYEGLGSIYWHMVSKLLLAVQECCQNAIEAGKDPQLIKRLITHYYEINEGIGMYKSPELYGAFPTDPYSHTPMHRGAQQPGMTGQVKEDIISRIMELGISVKGGMLSFRPAMLRKEEFLQNKSVFTYVDIHQKEHSIPMNRGSLCFTFCQVPIIYKIGDSASITMHLNDGSELTMKGNQLDAASSAHIFGRSGWLLQVVVIIEEKLLA